MTQTIADFSKTQRRDGRNEQWVVEGRDLAEFSDLDSDDEDFARSDTQSRRLAELARQTKTSGSCVKRSSTLNVEAPQLVIQ